MAVDLPYGSIAIPSPERDGLEGAANASAPYICFRTFFVIPSARRVMCDDGDVELGGRAFDLLIVLLRARGSVVPKCEIIRSVWPSTTVDECNLRFQMGLLRKALGQHRDVIKTIPGRGYMLADDFYLGPIQRANDCNIDCEEGLTADFGGDDIFELTAPGVTLSSADRIVELERENRRLRLAVANLAIDRLSAP